MALKILNLYPSTKFFIALCLGIASFFIPTYWYGLAVFLCTVVIALICGVGKEYLKTIRNSLLILCIFMLIMRALFSTGVEILWHLGPLTITKEGIWNGLNMISKVLALGSTLLLFFKLTEVKCITTALENFGMSPTATYVVLSAIQMIPEMKKQSDVIMDAQKTRGVETEGKLLVRMKAFIPTLGPLVLSSVANTEERVITLESRAFTAPVKKTRLFTLQKKPIDRIMQIMAILFLLGIIGWRVSVWLL